MFNSLERYIPLFQAYLKAENPQQYLQTLNDPTQKKLIQTLTEDITNLKDYQKRIQEIKLNPNLARELITLKLTNYLQNVKELHNDDFEKQIKRVFGTDQFDYSRPQTISANDPTGQKQDLTPSHLKVKQTLQSYLSQKLSNKPEFIRTLNDYGVSRVSQEVLLNLPLSEKEYLLDKCGIIYHFQKQFIANFLSQYEKEKRKTNNSYRLNSKSFLNLTKAQINHLGQSNPKMFENEDYIQLWFNFNYSERITKHIQDAQYFSKIQHENKRNQFIQIVKELSAINHSIIKAYVNKFKAEIMLLDIIVGDPSLQRLIQYLKSNSSASKLNELTYQYRNQALKKLRNDQTARIVPKMRYVLQIDREPVDKFVEEYLQKLFEVNNKNVQAIERLTPYLNRKYLCKLHAKATLFLGEQTQTSYSHFETEQLQKLKEEKSIKLHSTNKRKYRPNDSVELEVSIKNVDRIDVKIYELNLQKHYLTSQGQIQDDINLSFLRPAIQYTYSNQGAKSNPFKVVNSVLSISDDHIPKKMGVFIVDLQGDTITSRAIIRKGAILCLESFTEAGQKFSFYDQEGRHLTHKDGLKVWVQGKPKTLKEDTNCFYMDYVEKQQWITIIASMGSYAESYEKELKVEQYKFQVGYLYNPESFIVGKKAKIVLHGRLTMNNCSMSLQLLQNTKVKVTVTNNQRISTYYSFNIDKWLDKEDPSIEFPIQSYTSAINISIEGTIRLQTDKEANLSHSKQILIDLKQNQQNFIDIYLEKSKEDEYVLNVLGQNGEKITNTDVILNYSITGVQELERTKVKTDADGKVHLGKLSIVKQLSAEISAFKSTISKLWHLDRAEAALNYSNVIHVKVGQEIRLPVDEKWTGKDFILLRTFDKYYAEDISSQIKIHQGTIVLPTISNQGYYILKILPIDKVIEILTLKNYKWEGDTDENQKVYDQFSGKIYDINKNLYQNVNIEVIKQENLQNSTKIQVVLNMFGLKEEKHKNVRLHALASNYLSPEYYQSFAPQTFNIQPQLNQHYFYQKGSAYFNNKTLSDEGAYVWKRQRQNQRIIGNNLQKPGIFLKRALVRQTNQQNEDLDYEDKYIQECAMVNVDPNLRERVNPKKKEASSSNISRVDHLNSHNNFLALSGHIQNNHHGQVITFEIPNNYNNIELFILTPGTAIKKTISLGHTNSRKYKDLRNVGLKDTQNSKGWTMSRQVYELNVGKEMIISRSSLWRTVTLSDIYQFANAKRCVLYNWSSHLLSWNSYNEAKKREIYDKQCCHELNAFLYFQDKQFFNKVVKPYINNKISKTFVDLCLIGDANIKQFANIDKLSKLNAFEKVLLIHSLVSQNQKESAENVTKMLNLSQESIKKNYEQFKINFDTMINSKVGQQKEKKLLQMKGSKQKEYKRSSRMMGQQYFTNQSAVCQQQSMIERRDRRAQKKQAFVPIESTKQYTQRTYYNVKNYKAQSPYLVAASSFWAKLAQHLLSGKQTNFLSQQFMSLKSGIDFILAACFISSQSSANFELQVCGQNYKITAKSPMLLYVKQVKEVEYANKFGVQINQRFVDPQNMYTYEDGLKVEREVEEFVFKKPYIAQTVVTNTSGTPLELQILLDIPKGAIPLQSHQYTEIFNIVLRQYTSEVFKRVFYIPQEGEYPIYPSNACRGSTIIAKAFPKPNIQVKKYLTINKFQNFHDILRSGDKEKIIQFIKAKNIFDPNQFTPSSILWMLKDKEFYSQVIRILRERKYYNQQIWSFAFYHNDLAAIKEEVSYKYADRGVFQPTIFEYFPYYSSRTHQFANETKSTIRNVQFKESYLNFLVSSVVGIQDKAAYYVSLAYYLILQDRLKEANEILKKAVAQFPQKHEIQVDYMRCFLDMSLNTHNFEVAREIMLKYKEYPIQSWKKLFDQVRNSLQAQDNDYPEENQYKRSEEFQTQVIQQTGQFKIIQPADTTIRVEFFQINLEVFFSEYPFYDYKAFTAVKPSYLKQYPASSQTKEIIVKRKDFSNIRDATVEITQAKQGLPPKKVSTFEWANAELKVKVSENAGTLQVFVNKKKNPGAYVKVFSKKSYLQQFYRDGYTDMTGTFRYAMSDLEAISQFSILVLTDKGGIIQKVKPPSKLASY